MKCKDCSSCHEGWFSYRPNAYVCIGVKEPFIISDIEQECTEYPEKRDKPRIEDAIAHFKYGITHDIFSEPVTSYAKMAVESLEKQMSITTTLLPCPFCGGKPVLESWEMSAWDKMNIARNSKYWWHVFCDDCLGGGPDMQNAREAIEAWNRRC